jgi:GT2 family glycosyltransferase
MLNAVPTSASAAGRLRRKSRKALLITAQLLQGNPSGLQRVAAERIIPKLERFRDQRWADQLRIALLRWQPGIRASQQEIDATLAASRLLLPPGWNPGPRARRRLERLLAARMQRTGAAIVSCDDWIQRRDGSWTWRQKPLWDGLFDREVGIGEGPVLLSASLAHHLPDMADDPTSVGWRAALHQRAREWGGYAHVPLPLVRAPRPVAPVAFAALPRSRTDRPLVSVLIPTAGFRRPQGDQQEILVLNCLRSLVERSRFRNLEVVVIDGGELEQDFIEMLARLVEDGFGKGRWRFLRRQRPYSYTDRINLAAEEAIGEFLLQLNDDTELLDGDGLEALLTALDEPSVGIAGALLLYPDGRVQHAGTAIDNLAPRHAWAGCRPEHLPWGTLQGLRRFHAVTAAVCLCRRSLWDQLGGLSKHFPINYGDVDFCLRAAELGMHTVLSPRSRWIHHESVSRRIEVPPELPEFAARWGQHLGGDFCVDGYCSAWRHLLAPQEAYG